ncbi:bifunctional hydroxymethylpyrimidine kinase/phosphomethylpyrimidine kinase [Ottowia sp.]|uniref:bifunctional hydroxymethylpyrimidine kinase/phosphomethylpyrimidine kinase n=1 Tax=Ottowia sp. TaxID=1898956 RepID=UPI002D12712E|nr:bifunctional hydroxymethylpyrimidine kinase/phosphomethylpyrimidine kinase [Ottowia sp.]HRN74598.1 bifunctional hydroxymethylpyrimidine kinase/phosphomethylpyrimidine kinase [Ottowia sp.]HRQ01429.1 bifunctional hydroxymethylpyrimidine kinase/phosphomethylpyrimidine kinase [Ottowia sp.]
MDTEPRRPIVWSIAGNDSGGGAGLSADQRAAEAFGAHLCPVVVAVTAQNSVGVTRVEPVAPDLLEAQLAALFDDMPPAAVKTGLLGSADNVVRVARWIDRLRAHDPRVALVVDPVLGASTGAAFADEAVLRAYVEWLLPRATIVTPNEREARRLAATSPADLAVSSLAAIAQGLRAAGAQAVAITGGDDHASHGLSLDWIDTGHASGWLALPRIDTPHSHGTGCTFATSAACALALGFVPADALVLAKMATTQALRHGHAAGQGAGPVAARAGFAGDPALLPCLSWGDEVISGRCGYSNDRDGLQVAAAQPDLGIYAIVDSAERVRQVVAAGVRTVQLRIKTPDAPDPAWHAALRDAVSESLAACRAVGATLVVNDHWRLAAELAAGDTRGLAVHLGQEDLLALGATGRADLAASGLPLGISSHSLWELARARTLAPWYVACGPVWPTLTKAMPWLPQGLDNLAWWVHMAGVPVVAIGGILEPEQLSQAARSGASGVCVVRGLGDDPALSLPLWQAALQAGRADARLPVPRLPHPSLQAATLH